MLARKIAILQKTIVVDESHFQRDNLFKTWYLLLYIGIDVERFGHFYTGRYIGVKLDISILLMKESWFLQFSRYRPL